MCPYLQIFYANIYSAEEDLVLFAFFLGVMDIMELPNKHLHVIDLAKRDFHSNLFHLIKKCVNVSFPENNIKSFSVVAFVVIKKKKINILYLVIRKTFRRFSEHFPSVFWSFL